MREYFDFKVYERIKKFILLREMKLDDKHEK